MTPRDKFDFDAWSRDRGVPTVSLTELTVSPEARGPFLDVRRPPNCSAQPAAPRPPGRSLLATLGLPVSDVCHFQQSSWPLLVVRSLGGSAGARRVLDQVWRLGQEVSGLPSSLLPRSPRGE